MIKTKVGFLEGRLLSSQSELSEEFSKTLIGWKKAALQTGHFCFDHVNRLNIRNTNLHSAPPVCKLDFTSVIFNCNKILLAVRLTII